VTDFKFGGGMLTFIRVRFLQMMRVINKVVTVIGLRHYGDVVRGVAEPCSIWRGIFSLTIPRIESIHGLVGFDVTEMPWQDMIHDSEFIPFR
jgi:hypothetical protein